MSPKKNSKRKKSTEKSHHSTVSEIFRKFSRRMSCIVGSPGAFIAAGLTIIVWAALGPVTGFTDTWQLVINTGTTIITFLMVFLIQNTQNRDSKALHLKIDELIFAVQGARDEFVDLEELEDEELERLQAQFRRMHDLAGHKLKSRRGHRADGEHAKP